MSSEYFILIAWGLTRDCSKLRKRWELLNVETRFVIALEVANNILQPHLPQNLDISHMWRDTEAEIVEE
jgi:hypothetical protein